VRGMEKGAGQLRGTYLPTGKESWCVEFFSLAGLIGKSILGIEEGEGRAGQRERRKSLLRLRLFQQGSTKVHTPIS
jgi:hypothetical protein